MTIDYTAAWTYNGAGEMLSGADDESSYTYGYDGLGRLNSTDNMGVAALPHVVLTVPSGTGYDANGNRTALNATVNGKADFSTPYEYDTLRHKSTAGWHSS